MELHILLTLLITRNLHGILLHPVKPGTGSKMGDLFFRQDISMTARYGEEGVDWSMEGRRIV